MEPIVQNLSQIWMQGEDHIPEKYKPLQAKWKQLHPESKYMLWDEPKLRNLIAETLPDILPIWDGIQKMIIKVDIGKLAILWNFGGMYADMDMEPLKDVRSLLRGYELVFTQTYSQASKILCTATGVKYHGKLWINNAFVASIPKHPFWMECIRELHNSIKIPLQKFFYASWVAQLAGPELICRLLYPHLKRNHIPRIKIYSHHYFEPKIKSSAIKEHKRTIDDYELRPETVAVHFYSKSWLLNADKWSIVEIGIVGSGLGIFLIIVVSTFVLLSVLTIMRKKKKLKEQNAI